MNPLDWMLAALLTYSTVRAFLQGFFREAFAVGGLIVGLVVAGWGYHALALRLAGLIASPPVAQLTAFLAILSLIMIAATLTAKLLQKTATVIGLGILNRLAGAAFGFVRGCLLGVAILTALTAFLPTAAWMKTSTLSPYFLRVAHAVSFVMPSDLRHRLQSGAEQIKHTAPDWIKRPL